MSGVRLVDVARGRVLQALLDVDIDPQSWHLRDRDVPVGDL